MRRTRNQAGFTIIELMGVIMIIGVLAAIALPSYRANAVRAKMSEALIALSACRNMISEVYISAEVPPGAGEWGCEVITGASTYVDSITTTDLGTVKASLHGFGDLRIDFHNLTLTPLDNTGNPPGAGNPVTRWRCGSPIDGTDVPAQYLPNTCRG
jgi:type IV pilus assembly protein PilA